MGLNDTDKEFYKEVGERLKQARKAKGLTQNQVAEILGVVRSTVTQHERGFCNITHTVAKKYATLYDVTLDYLTGTESNGSENPFEEFENIDFTDSEITEIKAYIKYILSKRELSA